MNPYYKLHALKIAARTERLSKDELFYINKAYASCRNRLRAVFNETQFIQTFGRIQRNPKPNQTMNEQNLLPFNLDIAIKHPKRVYNTALKLVTNITCVTPLPDGSVAFQTQTIGGTNGYIYPPENVVRFMRIVAEPAYKPWTRENIPHAALAYVYRRKANPQCVTLMRRVDKDCVWLDSYLVYYQDLLDNYEWAFNLNGPWYPCGTKSGTPTA